MKCWTVATGNVYLLDKQSKEAFKFMSKQVGFVGVHPHYPDGTLWLYDSENNAKIAKNLAEDKGIICGRNICECEVDDRYMRGK